MDGKAGGEWTVRRAEALEDWSAAAAAADARSLFARPFAFDADVDDLTALFSQHGTVNAVRASLLQPFSLPSYAHLSAYHATSWHAVYAVYAQRRLRRERRR